MKQLLKALPLLMLWLVARPLAAAPIVYEPFPATYTPGAQLGGTVAGGSALWTLGNGAGSGSALIDTNNGVLSYSGFPDSSGYGITTPTASSRNRGFDFGAQTLSATLPSVYASFLYKVSSSPSVNKCVVYLRSSTGSGTPHAGVFLNSSSQLLVSKNSSTPAATATTALTAGQTYLVVLRYKFVAGSANDEVGLWLNPANSSFGADEASVPAPSISTTANSDLAAMQAFFVAGLTADASVQYMDEIRVGTNWADVVPSTVCTPAGISNNPVNVSAAVGETANFTVTATGSSRTYQWQLSTDNGANWNPVSTGTGGTSASYTTAALTGGDNGSKYRCVVSVACDSSTATSTAATLTVSDPTGKWFRSAGSGNWNNPATWEMSTDGNTWVAATLTPSALASNITVRAGHTVSVTAAATADDLTIAATGELDLSGGTLTLNDGSPAVDCTVNGVLKVTSTANSAFTIGGTAGLVFNSGSTFQWSGNAAPAIPFATWADGSTCLIDNTSASASVNCTGVSGQSFYDFTINYPSVGFRTRLNITGTATAIRRDLNITIPDVASASVQLLTNNGSALTIGRNFTFTGGGNSGIGTKILTRSANTETSTILVGGHVNLSGYVDWFSTTGGAKTIMEFTGLNATAQLTLDNTHLIPGNTNNVSFVQDTGCNVTLLAPVPGSASWFVGTNASLNTGGNLVRGSAAATFTLNPGSSLVGSGTNQLTFGFGTYNFAGTLNLGTLPALSSGDSFVAFGGGTAYNGSFSLITPGSWDTSLLNTSGTLTVSGVVAGTPRVTSTVNGGFQVLHITGGNANANFNVLTNPSLTTPKASWPVAGSGTLDGSGAANFTNPVGSGASFQVIQVP